MSCVDILCLKGVAVAGGAVGWYRKYYALPRMVFILSSHQPVASAGGWPSIRIDWLQEIAVVGRVRGSHTTQPLGTDMQGVAGISRGNRGVDASPQACHAQLKHRHLLTARNTAP